MTIILTSESSVTLQAVESHLGSGFFKKRLACISTAAVVYPDRFWVAKEQEHLRELGAEVVEVELSVLSKHEMEDALVQSEGIFVHGGNTFFLLQEMQRTGFKEFVREYVAEGKIYIGSSAESIVAGPRIDIIVATDDPAKAPSVDPCKGLNRVEVVPMVHFDVVSYFPAFRASFERAIETGVNVLPLRNDQFIVAEGASMRVISNLTAKTVHG